MRDELVTIKGIKDGLLISLDAVQEWQLVINELSARIDENLTFFAGARLTVDIGQRPVPKYALRSLKAAIERRGLNLALILSDSQTTLESATDLDLRTNTSGRATATPQSAQQQDETPVGEPPPISAEEDVVQGGVMIRKTLRSGRTIHSDGHVVVIGDVNAGAQIIAGGDVVIWGVLRGNVHAGAFGNDDAIICALELTPTQLRISGYTLETLKRPKSLPEIASIRDNQIVLESWNR